MSRTTRLTNKFRYKKHVVDYWEVYSLQMKENRRNGIKWTWDQNEQFWNHVKSQYGEWFYLSYRKAPSEWNNLFHTRPRRRKDKILCKKIVDGYYDYDDLVFPDGKKPFKYYW